MIEEQIGTVKGVKVGKCHDFKLLSHDSVLDLGVENNFETVHTSSNLTENIFKFEIEIIEIISSFV